MTEHPNLRCIARLFPLFTSLIQMSYGNVLQKCLPTCLCVKTSTGAGFLLSALLFQHTRNCPYTSLSTVRIPVHSPTVSLCHCTCNYCAPTTARVAQSLCGGARRAPCAGRRFAGGALWCSTADLRWPFGHAKRAAAERWVNLKRRKVAKESITGHSKRLVKALWNLGPTGRMSPVR